MSTERDATRIVRSWLEEGVTALPDRVLDLVLDKLPATPQRRAGWLARRFPVMNSNIVRFGVAAAAVIVLGLVGIRFLSGSNFGGPGATPTPTPTPVALTVGPLEAGTYVAHPFGGPLDSMSFAFTVPDGWQGVGPEGSASGVAPAVGTEGPSGAAMVFVRVTGLYSDPCHGNTAAPVPVGDTVEDLARALGEQSAYDATAPTDVTLSGYSGQRVDLQLPSDVDFGTCQDGAFWVWDSPPFAQGPGNRWRLWMLDVQGVRVVILAEDFVTTSAEDQAALQAIVQSIRIQP